MKTYEATEQAYKNGYEKGYEDGKRDAVKHGRWIPHNKGQNNWVECSECNTVGSPFWKRCPVCEAKMDGDGNGQNDDI